MGEATQPNKPAARSETDETLTKFNRGKAERVVLGKSPYGSMVRIVVAIALFVVIFGTIFYLMRG